MKKLFITLFTVLSFFKAISQEKFEIKELGFSMDAPKGWIEKKSKDDLENLKNYDLTVDKSNESLKASAATIVAFIKYDPKDHPGTTPTFKIRIMKTNSKDIQSLQDEIKGSIEELKKFSEQFRFTQEPIAVKISNKDAIKFSSHFTLKMNGKQNEIDTHSYYILLDGYYISLNFIEELGKEDNTALFEALINSIQIK